MKQHTCQSRPRFAITALAAAACLLAATGAHASEGFRMRQSPVGMFGGEIAAAAENPGFFGTASLSYINIFKVADNNGDDQTEPAKEILLDKPPFSGLYKLNLPEAKLDFNQNQTQLNLVAGYLTQSLPGEGRVAFVFNLPLIKQSRSLSGVLPAGTISKSNPQLPLNDLMVAGANAGAQTGFKDKLAAQNVDVSGVGDAELSAVWLHNYGGLKVAAGASLFVPTGKYDKNRGPNPGFGDFYTLRPGVAVTYALNPSAGSDSWDRGVTLAGRVAFGMNTTNQDTQYRSGNFVYLEGAVAKVSGDWGWGANLALTQQVTDDKDQGVVVANNRYKNYAFGPFISYKLPGKSSGVNLHYSRNFGSRNAIMTQALQVRFIKAW